MIERRTTTESSMLLKHLTIEDIRSILRVGLKLHQASQAGDKGISMAEASREALENIAIAKAGLPRDELEEIICELDDAARAELFALMWIYKDLPAAGDDHVAIYQDILERALRGDLQGQGDPTDGPTNERIMVAVVARRRRLLTWLPIAMARFIAPDPPGERG